MLRVRLLIQRTMTIRLLFSALLMFIFVAGVKAQTITGKVVDSKQQPIEGATIVLQTRDSTYMDAVVSNADGTFVLNHELELYCLIIQHLLYNTQKLAGAGHDAGVIVLEMKDYALNEVVIKAERPFVKVEGGRLQYDLEQLAGNKIVNNAYEALTKLPGIKEDKGELTLAGAGNVTVILNGKPATMNSAQLATLLRNTPIDRVEKAEVMYSAPPQYHVRGAVINLIFKRPDEYSFQGEVGANYTNHYYNSGSMNGNFRISTPKMSFDVMYGVDNKKQMEYMNIFSKHTLIDEVSEINQNNRISTKYWSHNLRTVFDYNFGEKSNLSLSYTGNFNPNQHNNSRTTGNFQASNTDKFIDTRMHNVSLNYHSGFGLDIGGDYTRYTSNNDQNLLVNYKDNSLNHFNLSAGQHVERYSIYADQSHRLPKSWEVGYGASYKFADDHNYQIYNEVTGDIHTQDTDSKLKEQTTDFYVSVGKKYENGTSFSLSATGEYYTIGDYHKWAVYPQATLNYMKVPKHVFQLSLSTDKTYPGYWDMQSSVSYIDGYTELWGTPGIRPMTTYSLNGNYILKQKYIFGLFFTHAADYFVQTAYQSSERLALIYQTKNWDFMRLWGANVIIPFKVGEWLDSQLTLTGMQMHQRCDDFYDIPFNRKKWLFSGALDNTFKITNNLSLELVGNVQTPAIQGTFDINSVFNLTAGLKWNFAKGKATLSARCNDILETGMPNIKIRFEKQHLDMNNAYYSRAFTVHFSFRFGGYSKKEMKAIDVSRFGM